MMNELVALMRKTIIEDRDEIINGNARLIGVDNYEQAKFNSGRIVAYDEVLDLIDDIVRRLNAGEVDEDNES